MFIQVFKKTENIKLSKNFSLSEFACKCSKCDIVKVDLDHVKRLQKLRDDLGCPITINSAYRCPDHNKAIGGTANSQHVTGTATDITVQGMSPDEVADACEHFEGLGRYDTFTHVDSRNTGKARWDLRKNDHSKTTQKSQLPSGPTKEEMEDELKKIENSIL